ncbi:MAG: glycosyltransferase [Betaproteobacteria bacterium]
MPAVKRSRNLLPFKAGKAALYRGWPVRRGCIVARGFEAQFQRPARCGMAQCHLRRLRPEEDREQPFLRYRGADPLAALHETCADADAFVFASSCENQPDILREATAASLPIACSRRGPVPEVLGEADEYFDPENVCSIERTLWALVLDPPAWQRFGAAAERPGCALTREAWSRAIFAFLAGVTGGGA